MANPVTTTWASATKYDLTGTAVNPQAYEQSTPRQGGFTLQNRINFDAVTANTLTNKVGNVLKLVRIPPRTIVNKVNFCVPPGQTTVNHKYMDSAGSALSSASAGKSSAVLNIGYINYKTLAAYKASSATSQVYDVDDLADLVITASTGAITAASLPQWSASSQSKGVVDISDAGAPTYPHIFPYGGWLAIQPGGGASFSSVYGQMTGDLHIIMDCEYMPE